MFRLYLGPPQKKEKKRLYFIMKIQSFSALILLGFINGLHQDLLLVSWIFL